MYKSPPSAYGKKSESGLALILVIGILTILLMVGLTMVNVMRVEEKSADNFYIKIGARYFSKSGFDHAVNTLKRDVTEVTLTPEYDVMGTASGDDDCWRSAFVESNAATISAYPDLVTEVAPEKYPGVYSRWLYVKRDQTGFIVLDDYNFDQDNTPAGAVNTPRYGIGGSTTTGNYEIIGRYAILVTDEAGKANVNVAGDYSGTLGDTPFELRLNSVLESAHSAGNPDRQVDSTVADDLTEDIVNWRYGDNDASPPEKFAGEDVFDDDLSNPWMENDGIDNDADGSVDEANEGVDDPGEFNPDLPFYDSASNTARDRPIDSIYDLLLIPSFADVSLVQNGSIPTTAQALMDAISPYVTANSRDYNQFCRIDAGNNITWRNKISLNALLDAQAIYDEIDTSNFLAYSASSALYDELRRSCANIADAFDYDLFPSKIANNDGSEYFYGVESVRINEIGKLSGYVRNGSPVTSGGGNWVANGTMIQCPNTALETASYTISLPAVSGGIYTVYFKSGPTNSGLTIVLEPGTGYEQTLHLDGANAWIGANQTVTADGTLNINITNQDTASATAVGQLAYSMVMARYIELINLSERAIPIAGWRFSVDGGSNYYYIPTTNTSTIPAADYDENTTPADPSRYGYLVLATNLYAFEATWDNGALSGSLADTDSDGYWDSTGDHALVLTNMDYTDSGGSAIAANDDWGVAAGSNPLGASSLGDIIVEAPTNAAASTWSPIAWVDLLSINYQNKTGWMVDTGLSTLEYEENCRECVSAVSDESPWAISSASRFSGSMPRGEIKGSPGMLNDNAGTVSMSGNLTTGTSLLWKVPSAPVGNPGLLGDVTLAAEYNVSLYYNNDWSIDVSPFFTTDQHFFDSACATQSGTSWTTTTPDGSVSTPYVYPYATTYLRGSSGGPTLTWQVENASAVYSCIPTSGRYSLFIAGNYLTNPNFEYLSATHTLNASNLYDAGLSSSYLDADRELVFGIDASSDFDFDYAVLAPTKYTYGKININTATVPALKALTFTGALEAADITAIITDTNKPYISPGDVVRVLTGGTDDIKRAKWRKISRYVTVRSDVYEIIVVGQTIKDQTPGDDFDPTNDKLSASDRLIGIVDRGEYRADPPPGGAGKVKVLHMHSE